MTGITNNTEVEIEYINIPKTSLEIVSSGLKNGKEENRICFIDSLRGIGLLGLAIIHYLHWHTSGPLSEDVLYKLSETDFDKSIFRSLKFLISFKFFAIFSFVFGLSFYLQIAKKFNLSDFLSRIILLFLFGILHSLFWRGDILIIYAPLAVILCLYRNVNSRLLLLLSLFFILNIPGIVLESFDFNNFYSSINEEYHHMIVHGDLADIILFNTKYSIEKFQHQVRSGRLFVTLGYFFLGMFVGRKNLYKLQLKDKRYILNIVIGCSIVLLLLLLNQKLFNVVSYKLLWVRQIENSTMTIFYISILALIYYNLKFRKILDLFSNVGRMSLTNYILQTVIGLLIFYNVGYSLYGKTSSFDNFLIALSVFVFQLLVSHFWLKYFNYGILEWIWRCAYKRKYFKLLKDQNLNSHVHRV